MLELLLQKNTPGDISPGVFYKSFDRVTKDSSKSVQYFKRNGGTYNYRLLKSLNFLLAWPYSSKKTKMKSVTERKY